METTQKQIVLGILAHVDSGKTTLSEAMLYRTGAIRKLGRVDHGDAFLDTDSLEKARGITIFSKQALLKTGSTSITLLDTPGHVDFSTETERTLQVLDYAVLVVSGTDGVQSHTETLWRLLRRYHIPTFVFINKMDLPGPGKEALLGQLSRRLGEGFVDFGAPQAERDEALALCDERLMETMLDAGGLDAEMKALCQEEYTALKKQLEELEQEPESDVLLETLVQTDERNRILWRCMDELAPAYREALYLVYFEGMRHAEAAAVMRKTEKQIADLVYRGRASLRKTLEREGITTWYI